jgi:hypothetical protein
MSYDSEDSDKITLDMLTNFLALYDHRKTDYEIDGDVMDAEIN